MESQRLVVKDSKLARDGCATVLKEDIAAKFERILKRDTRHGREREV